MPDSGRVKPHAEHLPADCSMASGPAESWTRRLEEASTEINAIKLEIEQARAEQNTELVLQLHKQLSALRELQVNYSGLVLQREKLAAPQSPLGACARLFCCRSVYVAVFVDGSVGSVGVACQRFRVTTTCSSTMHIRYKVAVR
jgi:hypothetical protein